MKRYRRRVSVLLDEARYRMVADAAARRGIPVSAVIRQAIDDLPVAAERRRRAFDAILSAEPMPVPVDPSGIRVELDQAHDRFG